MRIVVFGDIHGNIDAFEALVKREKDADLFLCLGDIVGYGPFANECIALLKTLKYQCVIGNHEEMFIAGEASQNCSTLAKKFFDCAYPHFDNNQLAFLKALPTQIDLHNFTAQHTLFDQYIYANTPTEKIISAKGNFFIGHSHCQFSINHPQLKIINPGSLGQNRKHKAIASYLVWLPESNSFSFENFVYDVEHFMQKMITAGYPAELVTYYKQP